LTFLTFSFSKNRTKMPNPLEDALGHAGRSLAGLADAVGSAAHQAQAAFGQLMAGGRPQGRVLAVS
jgi:hypothetical protein